MPLDPTVRLPAIRSAAPSLRVRLAVAAALIAAAPVSPPEYVEFTGEVPVSQVLAPVFAPRANPDGFYLH